jgi:hypothetical protein
MRFRFLAFLGLLFAACSSQSRPEDDPWANYQPSNRPTYDETYEPPPRQDTADAAVERAARAQARGRSDEARVEYQVAFRDDRWHVPANEGYQDLMLGAGLFDALWREYLDLWQTNTARGDAFYYHLRPLLSHRGRGAVKLEKRAVIPDETLAQINTLLQESTEAASAGKREDAVAAIDNALKLADLPALHRVRIELLSTTAWDDLLQTYETRAEEAPQSGDALALNAKVVSYRDKLKALNLLREGYVLELPGFWLPFGIAEICRDLGDEALSKAGDKPTRDQKRNILGWYAASRDFYEVCKATRPNDPETLTGWGYVKRQIERVAG